jgi:thymidylate kinase
MSKVNLPFLDGVDPSLNVPLTITVEEALARIGNVQLTDPAHSKEFLQKLLDEVEAAKKAKMASSDILNLVLGVVKKVLVVI